MRSTSLLAVLACLALPAGTVHAQAHVHGQGEAAIVLAPDGTLRVDLIAPAGDLVGFEREPANAAERAALEAVEVRMRDPLVSFAADAGCTLTGAGFSGPGSGGHDPSGQAGHDHHDHAHDHFSREGAPAGGSHADIAAAWSFACSTPRALGHADFAAVFQAFPGLVRIEAAALLGREPFFGVLTAQRSRLDLDQRPGR